MGLMDNIWVLIVLNSPFKPIKNSYNLSFSLASFNLFPISQSHLLQVHRGAGELIESHPKHLKLGVITGNEHTFLMGVSERLL